MAGESVRSGPQSDESGDRALGWGLLLAPIALLVCCGGPLLVAGLGAGILAGIGAHAYWLVFLLALAAVVVIAALSWRRLRARRGGGDGA